MSASAVVARPLSAEPFVSRAGLTRPAPLWPFVVARIYCGVVFLTAGVRQVTGAAPWVKPGQTWAGAVREQLVEWGPRTAAWYRPVIDTLWMPHISGVAATVAWLNVLVGVTLLLGLLTRPAAAVGLAMLLNYLAASGSRLYYPGPVAAETALLVAILLTNPGQLFGLDAALTRRGDAKPHPLAVPAWTALPLRLYLGAAFLYAASNKVGPTKWSHWPAAMAGFAGSQLPHSARLYRPFLGAVLAHSTVVAPIVAVAEVVVGIALLLGAGTRWAATIGILLTANYFLMKGDTILDVSNDLCFIVGLTIVLATDAGRTLGVDGLRPPGDRAARGSLSDNR